MKTLQFTIPVADNKTITTTKALLPFFYPYLHRHAEVQLTWVIKGEGTLVVGNSMYGFTDNEIYWISPNQPHVYKSTPECFVDSKIKNVEKVDIFFDTEAQLGRFFDIPEVKHLKDFLLKYPCGFKVPAQQVQLVSDKMQLVHQSAGLEQFICFIDLLKTLSSIDKPETFSAAVQSAPFKEDEGIRISTIYNYVMQHYTQPITLEEVSKLAYMTPQAFCRYFKKHTHHTLVSFINQVRINEACKKLVEHQHDSIASVAYNTGFNSITNFNRVFKSVTKKSPKEYVDTYYSSVNQRQPGTNT